MQKIKVKEGGNRENKLQGTTVRESIEGQKFRYLNQERTVLLPGVNTKGCDGKIGRGD